MLILKYCNIVFLMKTADDLIVILHFHNLSWALHLDLF